MSGDFYDDALHMMERQGGSFVRSLADCYHHADPVNAKILRKAFAHYFDQYESRYKKWRESNEQPTPPLGG